MAGFPYRQWFEKLSITRYLDHSTLLQFMNFKRCTNRQCFVEINYGSEGMNFPWNDENPICDGKNGLGDWDCAFVNLVKQKPPESPKIYPFDMEKVWSYKRKEFVNNPVEFLLYGKLLEMGGKPSQPVRDYMVQKLRVQQSSANGGQFIKFGTFEEFEAYATNVSDTPSVTMHVRQGDSCSFVIHKESIYYYLWL
jgi:hypothetical protein